VTQLAAAAAQRGCLLRSAWATSGGQLVGHILGAPAFVNARFEALYPGGVGGDAALILVCDRTTGSGPAFPPLAGTFRTLQGTDLAIGLLEGRALLLDGSTRAFIGAVSSDRSAPDSICNPSGQYGNSTSLTSIRNRAGPYGRPEGGSIYEPYFDSQVSAYSRNANTPPQIVMDGTHVGFLTAGQRQAALHPDALLAALGCP
jgi:hypothetical protein